MEVILVVILLIYRKDGSVKWEKCVSRALISSPVIGPNRNLHWTHIIYRILGSRALFIRIS
jgi:hypothetical protein